MARLNRLRFEAAMILANLEENARRFDTTMRQVRAPVPALWGTTSEGRGVR
jgi:hypothetical protein